jgi:hypothetical protein
MSEVTEEVYDATLPVIVGETRTIPIVHSDARGNLIKSLFKYNDLNKYIHEELYGLVAFSVLNRPTRKNQVLTVFKPDRGSLVAETFHINSDICNGPVFVTQVRGKFRDIQDMDNPEASKFIYMTLYFPDKHLKGWCGDNYHVMYDIYVDAVGGKTALNIDVYRVDAEREYNSFTYMFMAQKSISWGDEEEICSPIVVHFSEVDW